MSNEESFRMMELGMQGYNCSQILMQIALEAQQKENHDLVRAMTGLLAGMGCGKTCGAMTGGCCVLGFFAGKGLPESNPDELLSPMLNTFVEWFETKYMARYGSINCAGILDNNPQYKLTRCPEVVAESLEKIEEILAENGYEFRTV